MKKKKVGGEKRGGGGGGGRAREEMIKKSKNLAVPVIDVDGEIIIGFDKTKLEKLLLKK